MDVGQVDTLQCGCVVKCLEREGLALVFLTPCTEAHRELALRIRSTSAGRSSLVVKAVPR